MNTALVLKVLAAWLVILVAAVLNGWVRETLLVPLLGSFNALILSGVVLVAIVFAVAYFAVPTWGALTTTHYAIIGVIWLVLTLAFEFVFGLYIQRQPLSEVLGAYTFEGGNLWPLVLVATVASPWIAPRLRAAGV